MLFALAALRLRDHGRFGDALLLGLAGGLACLTRITAPTLVAPVVLALAVFPRRRPLRRRLELAGVAALVSFALCAPFLASCWLRFGDPFYSINEHVVFYRTRSNLDYTPGMTVAGYLSQSFRPFQLLDTAFVGYTSYSFGRKWSFEDWAPSLGPALAYAAGAGMLLLTGPGPRPPAALDPRRGPAALRVHPRDAARRALAADTPRLSLLPDRGGAGPLGLVPAGHVGAGPRALRARLRPRRVLVIGAGLVVLAGVSWGLWQGLAYLRFAEAVRAGNHVTRVPVWSAGPRDAWVFAEGWYPSLPINAAEGRYCPPLTRDVGDAAPATPGEPGLACGAGARPHLPRSDALAGDRGATSTSGC